ncbi:MAG: carbohydrate kinase family protein [Candidatus Magasanikbacteria bacterium]|nr:carbohydrate kinase family protein [Candidatus Magasanikbacteria bacterium]
MKKFDIIVIGDSTMDTILMIDDAQVQCDLKKEHCQICLNYADKIPISQTVQSLGGNAANIAAGCKQLGLKTAIVTELGDDINGAVIKQEFDKIGIDTKFVRLNPKNETRYSVVLSYLGERTILSYHAKRKYSLPNIPATKWLYYTSVGDNFHVLQKQILNYLKKHPDCHLACNPGSYHLKKDLAGFKPILPMVELLFVNKEEAEKLVGEKLSLRGARRSLGSARDKLRNPVAALLSSLLKLGVKTAVITDGENGSYAANSTERYHLPAYDVKIISKTGAGDAYASGFLSATANGKSLAEAMRWGTANSSGVIQQIGAQTGLLNKSKIEEMVGKFIKVKIEVL